ncbi:glycoside hydrolase family 43 protein [Sphingomonas sp. PL20]|uniref:glycoside hydrolase family 43 protein n=1 Tax=Sphingomonas sp. PL20 TaxID=2760712 RepID=UPI001AE7EC77
MRRVSASFALVAPLALVAVPALGRAAPPRYTNPILYADYSDPDVIRVGADYYLVASSFHLSPGLPVLRSRDLVHWTIVANALPRLPFSPLYNMPGPHALTDAISKPIGGTKYASGVWAPAIRHHAGRFFIYFPTPDEGIFMTSATRVEGPWSAPVAVIAGAGLEDPCPFWDDDGSAWLIHGKVGAGPLILHRMSADGTRVLDAGIVVADDPKALPVLEGPKLYKRDGWYYIWAPIGGVDKGDQAVGRARHITGPYEWRTVLTQGTTAVQGPHQGAWVETPSGQGWFAHFNSTGAFGRITYLEPVHWKDGWPIVGDPPGQPVTTYPFPDTGNAPTRDRLQDSDEFASPRLGLQWSWNHNPDPAGWSLTERPGWLRLRARPAEHLVTARDTLTQVLQGPNTTASARIDVRNLAPGQRAGLAMFGVRPSWIGVVGTAAGGRVTLSVQGIETPGPVVTGTGTGTVVFRVAVGPEQTARYAYSLDDGRHFTTMSDAIPLARFSWWKGSRPALFSYGAAGWVDIDWFHVAKETPHD